MLSMTKLGPKGAKTHCNLSSPFFGRVLGVPSLWSWASFPTPLLKILFRSNAIAQVNRLGLVACKLHGKGTGHASALRITYSRPPEVMDQFFGAASLSGRNIPG